MPLDPKALADMESEFQKKKAEAKVIIEKLLGRPVTEPIVEQCPIDLNDTEDINILHEIWDDIARQEGKAKG